MGIIRKPSWFVIICIYNPAKQLIEYSYWLMMPFLTSNNFRHKLVLKWRIGAPPPATVAQAERASGVAFRGRSYRLGG